MVPVAEAVASSSTNPSPVIVTSGFVKGVPSYVFELLALVSVTGLLVMVSEPLWVVILLNWFVTSSSPNLITWLVTILLAVPKSVISPVMTALA